MLLFLVSLILSTTLCEDYVTMSVYSSSSCSESTARSQWVFPLPSICTTKPFGDSVVFTYNDSVSTVYYTTYEYSNCTSVSENISYITNMCYEVNEYGSVWSLNFTVSSVLPFNRSLSKNYFVQDNFQDMDCVTPVDGTITEGTTTTIKKLDPQYLGDTSYGLDTLFYCTDDWFVEEITDSDYSNIECWKFQPNGKSGQCLNFYNETFYVNPQYKSILPTCMDEETFEDTLLPEIPDESAYSYMLLNSHYEGNCSMAYYIKPWYLDICNHVKSTSRVPQTLDSVYHIKFVGEFDSPCQDGILYRVDIHKQYAGGKPYFYGCDYVGPDSLYSELDNFLERRLVDDVHYPDMIAIIATSQVDCGEDITPIKEDPGPQDYFSYIQEQKCIGGEERGLEEDRSFSGRCIEGNIKYNEYVQSDLCFGYYEKNDEDWCSLENSRTFGFDRAAAYKYHYTCVFRYCDGYGEFDYSNVCTGRGVCEANDVCSCYDSYEGDFCETWSCNEIDYKITEEACHGNGECVSPDRCLCDSGYNGEFCDESSSSNTAAVVVGVVLGSIFGLSVPIFCLLLCIVFVVFFLCCCVGCLAGCILLSTIACISGVTVIQRRRLAKFGELEDVDMVLSEQRAEKDASIAHLKINKKLFEIPFEEVVIEKLIGEGGSEAKVFLAEWQNQKVAFKCFKISKVCSSQDRFDLFESEVNVLAALLHPNIIRFFGASLKPPRVGIVMEYCENGEILEYILKVRKEKPESGYPVSEKIRMCREIVSAINYIHKKSIIHRDLKPDNILLDRICSCKLMDFGISKVVESTEGEKTRRIGTKSYMAPEIITGLYDEKCDIYSFSILAYTLFSENPQPYGAESTNTAVEFKVANDPFFRPNLEDMNISFKNDPKSFPWMKEVLKKCWSGDPRQRFNSTELLGVFDNESSYLRTILEKRREKEKEEVIELKRRVNEKKNIELKDMKIKEKNERVRMNDDIVEVRERLEKVDREREKWKKIAEESEGKIQHLKMELEKLENRLKTKEGLEKRLATLDTLRKRLNDKE